MSARPSINNIYLWRQDGQVDEDLVLEAYKVAKVTDKYTVIVTPDFWMSVFPWRSAEENLEKFLEYKEFFDGAPDEDTIRTHRFSDDTQASWARIFIGLYNTQADILASIVEERQNDRGYVPAPAAGVVDVTLDRKAGLDEQFDAMIAMADKFDLPVVGSHTNRPVAALPDDTVEAVRRAFDRNYTALSPAPEPARSPVLN